jgi:hypothetical protein
MATRYCGNLKLDVRLAPVGGKYGVIIHGPDGIYRTIVGAPRSSRLSEDSPEALDQAAHAALSFADDEGYDVSGADMTEWGWSISRQAPLRRNEQAPHRGSLPALISSLDERHRRSPSGWTQWSDRRALSLDEQRRRALVAEREGRDRGASPDSEYRLRARQRKNPQDPLFGTEAPDESEALGYHRGHLQGYIKITEDEIAEFRRTWPASGLHDLTGVWVQFDEDGQVLDIVYANGTSEDWDGPALVALLDDARGRAGLTPNAGEDPARAAAAAAESHPQLGRRVRGKCGECGGALRLEEVGGELATECEECGALGEYHPRPGW